MGGPPRTTASFYSANMCITHLNFASKLFLPMQSKPIIFSLPSQRYSLCVNYVHYGRGYAVYGEAHHQHRPRCAVWISAEEVHHQYGGEWVVWITHIISADNSVQYKTTKTARDFSWLYLSGKIIFYRQSYQDVILL